MKPNNEWEDKLKLVKLVVDEDYDELVTNIGSSLSDRNLKRLIDFISKTLQQQREEVIEEIEDLLTKHANLKDDNWNSFLDDFWQLKVKKENK